MKIKEYRKFQIQCEFCDTAENVEILINIYDAKNYMIEKRIQELLPKHWETIIVQKSLISIMSDIKGFKCPNCSNK